MNSSYGAYTKHLWPHLPGTSSDHHADPPQEQEQGKIRLENYVARAFYLITIPFHHGSSTPASMLTMYLWVGTHLPTAALNISTHAD